MLLPSFLLAFCLINHCGISAHPTLSAKYLAEEPKDVALRIQLHHHHKRMERVRESMSTFPPI
jgi:hypothetical protein